MRTHRVPSRQTVVIYVLGLLPGFLVGVGVSQYTFKPPGHNMYMPKDIHPSNLLFQTHKSVDLQQWVLHKEYQDLHEISLANGITKFDIRNQTNDEWAYIFLDPAKYKWFDVAWELRIRRDTPFREYAFNFRYQDFDNRYRYRFEDNFIYFDKKIKGVWYNNIGSVRFPMTLGGWYNLRIDTYKNVFRCYVNGKLMIENSDTDLTYGSIAIILWEDDGVTDIVPKIGPVSIKEI